MCSLRVLSFSLERPLLDANLLKGQSQECFESKESRATGADKVLTSNDLHSSASVKPQQWMSFLPHPGSMNSRPTVVLMDPDSHAFCFLKSFLLLSVSRPADDGRRCQGKEGLCPEVCSVPHSRRRGQAQGGPQPLGSVRTQDRPGTGLLVHRCQQE